MMKLQLAMNIETDTAITCSSLTMKTLEQRSETCSERTIKKAERRLRCRSGVFTINLFHTLSQLTLNR